MAQIFALAETFNGYEMEILLHPNAFSLKNHSQMINIIWRNSKYISCVYVYSYISTESERWGFINFKDGATLFIKFLLSYYTYFIFGKNYLFRLCAKVNKRCAI